MEELAAELATAERLRVPAIPVTRQCADLTLDQAYDIQWINIRRRIGGGARVIGHKVGLTSLAMQQQMGVTEPDSGVLLDDMVVPDAGELRCHEFLSPRIEAEIAFRLGRDISGPTIDVDVVRDAVVEVALTLEVIDTRFGEWRVRLADSVADNASSARVVVGPAVPFEPHWDVENEQVVVHVDGAVAASGEGRAVLGNPLHAVVWLARQLRSRGAELTAGDVVLAGSVHASLPIRAATTVRATAASLPPVQVRVV